ncbi:FeoA family protein [Aquibacillus kalidii]|uniref:FeoA family protein n=1 Tax=Aquibacillus kalidii TaxID=2762597 RepID=UPI00164780EB|nr:FeoA family protein [Aquibacillus kalidii]
MNLTELAQGEKAHVRDFSAVSKIVQRRLVQLGVKENEEICLKRKLPFGGPCMIETCGLCISIRLDEAMRIEVRK